MAEIDVEIVEAEFTNSITKLNSASRPFQALKLEWHDKQYLMLHAIEAIRIFSLCATFVISKFYLYTITYMK